MMELGKSGGSEMVGIVSEDTLDQKGFVRCRWVRLGKRNTLLLNAGQNVYLSLVLSFFFFLFYAHLMVVFKNAK